MPMRVSSITGQVRAFAQEDIPQVADLHRRVFRVADHTSEELLDSYRTYFTQVLLDHPWRDYGAESLVHEEAGGRITGFLAVAARRMCFNGQDIQARIGSQLVVDPDSRGMAGLKLMSAFLAGPQDLSIADEANAVGLQMWEGFGGVTSFLYSLQWMYPLRPGQFARSVMTEKKVLPPFSPRHQRPILSRLFVPLAWTLDALVPPILKKLSVSPECRVVGEELTCDSLLACLAECGERSLRPVYDQRSIVWILQRADQLRRNGSLQKILVKTERQEVAGWYLYYLKTKGISEVVQLYANPGFAHAVLGHLFGHAESHGAIVLGGRLEPSLTRALSERHCLFHGGPYWALFHSRRPELLHALHRGDAFFSRLEGEWCLHFK